MNYSENTTGRKVVKGSSTKSIRQKTYQEKILKLLIVTLVLGIIIGSIGTTIVFSVSKNTEQKSIESTDEKVFLSSVDVDEKVFVPLDVSMDTEYQEFVYNLSNDYNIDWTLVMALIQKESSFKSDVVSASNDYGLMQINKINHEWLTDTLGVTDYLDSKQNITAGMYILQKLFKEYKEPELVLMCYNMGEGGAARLWEEGIYSTSYTEDILKIQEGFKEQLN